MSSSKRSKEGQYVPLPYAQLKSAAWRDLSGAAVKLWLELHTRFNGGNNGKLTLSFAEASEALSMGKATDQRAFAELVEHGFLELGKEGSWYHRRAHEWRLTTKPTHSAKGKEIATNEWRSWTPTKTKRGSRTERSAGLVVPFENPRDQSRSDPEPVKAKSATSVGSETKH